MSGNMIPCFKDPLLGRLFSVQRFFSQSLILRSYPANLQNSYECEWWRELGCAECQYRFHEPQSGIQTPDLVDNQKVAKNVQ